MTITLRQESATGATTKNSSLNYKELDDNFKDLLANKIQQLQVDADTGSVTVGEALSNGVLTLVGGTNVTTSVTEDSGGNATITIDATDSVGISNVVEDTTPQLGGNLDTNGNKLVTLSNLNLILAPNGTGVVEIQGDGSSADGTIQLNCSQNSHGIKLASPPHSAGQSYTITFPSTAPGANKIFQTDANGDLSFVDIPTGTLQNIVEDTTPQLGGSLDAQSNNFTSVGTINGHTIPGGTGTFALTSDISGNTTYSISAETTSGGANLRLTDSSAGTDDVKIAEGTNITVTRTDANTITIASTVTSGISDVVSDTSPQLGGSLDVNGNAIVSTSNQNINLNPDGSGKVQINNTYTLPNSDGSNGQVLTTDGAGTLSFTTVSSGGGGISNISEDTTPQLGGNLDVNGQSIVSTSAGDINITPDGAGKVVIDGLNYPTADGSNGQVMTTDGAGNLSFTTVSSGASSLTNLSDVTISSVADNQFLRYDNGSSAFVNETVTLVDNLNDLSDVNASGPTDGQVIQYNNGASQWQAVTLSFLSNVSEDSTPQLGGTLDCQDNIVQSADFKDYKETVHSLGSTDNPSIDVANGNVQSVTITSALNLPAFSNPSTGQSVTLIVSGSGTASGTGSYKFAGGNKTLTNDSIVSIFYDGTTYFASVSTDFQA